MTAHTEARYLGDLIKREHDTLYTRETVTIASGQNLALGAVVGLVTASGKYTALATSGTDGNQNAAGLLIADVDASAADATGVILARGPAVVAAEQLQWPAGITEGQKAAAMAQLVTLGIVARTEI